MKFVCLLHESELLVTIHKLTEYEGSYTSIRHTIYINYSDTHQIATTGSTKYKTCKSETKHT